jgi:poly(hydroxyalkanoate) depolymerase family esterase
MPDTPRETAARGAGMQEEMAEATRLTRAGRLDEATALIQRALGGGISPDAFATPTETTARGTSSPLISLPDTFPGGVLPGGVLPPVIEPDALRARTPEPEVALAGRFVAGSFTNRAGTRAYKLYVPSGAEGRALPLLVMLHGCTQGADDLAAGTRMNELAESGSFFVVYPEQSANANGQRCWNWFKADDQRRDSGEPSIIAGITRQIAATQPVDTQRIYVAGMSAGGAMAVIMGATFPDLYAAVGVHSGLAYGAAHDMPSAFMAMKQGAPDPAQGKTRAAQAARAVDFTRSVPTIVFHGDRDGTVHPRNGEQVLHQWADGAGRATVRQGQVSGGRAYTRSVYQDAEGQPVAERWVVHGAGHAWSGGSSRGSYTDPHGPDASTEMVRFFLEHPRG